MSLTIGDIQEQTIESLRKEIRSLSDSLSHKDEELQEVRSLMFIMLELLGGELTIVQEEHSELIAEILRGRVGLDIRVERDGEVISLKKVYII